MCSHFLSHRQSQSGSRGCDCLCCQTVEASKWTRGLSTVQALIASNKLWHDDMTWRHNSAEGGSILTKFVTSMQNETPMTKIRPKSKPEVVFQYGGRPFSQTGSSFNSAVDWDISSKFGMQIDFHLFERVQSRNRNPEVDFRLYGRHLEKSIWRHNSAASRPIMTKFGTQMQNDMPMTTRRSKSKPEVKFQYGGRPFSQTGSSFNSAVDWDISSKFGMHIDFHLLKRVQSRNRNPEVYFRLYGRHLEKSIWPHNSAANRPIMTKFGTQMQNDMTMTTHRS